MIYELSEKVMDFIESRRGLYITSIVLLIGYIACSFANPIGLHNPGVYIFGVIVPISASIYLAQKNWAMWIGPLVLFLASLIIVIADTMLRLGKV
ncbi:MAG: hypothetical protein HWE27_11080 [Gammaproteobacteria bacterium]|nr:hypothetical protein [Gammaproteobacteria bacterium]